MVDALVEPMDGFRELRHAIHESLDRWLDVGKECAIHLRQLGDDVENRRAILRRAADGGAMRAVQHLARRERQELLLVRQRWRRRQNGARARLQEHTPELESARAK